MKPIDIPTQATAEFIASYVSPGASVLEVGCGRGHVARELLNRGYRVNAVDADPESVAEARERGVPAVQASWPDHEGGAVDAVAFTRSFHHIGPLAPALRKARELSSPTGMLLVEDFAFDEADASTIAWLLRVLCSRTGSALVASSPGEFVTEILGSNDPDASWRQWHHDHGVHTAAAMKRAIGDHFAIRETRSVPYLYRYLVPAMPETAAAAAFVDEVFHEEARLGERSAIVLVGRRTVADAGGRQAPLRT